MALLTVRCPRCHHDMKYQPQGGLISEKTKRCVYCGRSFKIHSALPKSRIVEVDRGVSEEGFSPQNHHLSSL